MNQFVTRLREKSDSHKNVIAFCSSAAITLVIFAGWAITVPGQWAALSSPVSPQGQTAAASLSVITEPEQTQVQGSNSGNSGDPTQILQQNLNQGFQFLNSFKNSVGDLFSGKGASNGASGTSAESGASSPVSILDTTPVPVPQISPSNPYTNLKYYVSNGVLISDPKK